VTIRPVNAMNQSVDRADPWWAGAVAGGAWLSLTAVWPTSLLTVWKTQLMWQPLFIMTLTILTLLQGPRVGWGISIGRSLWMFAIFTVSGWLPFLRNNPSPLSYPQVYELYLVAYEVGLAALVGWQAVRSASTPSPSWWASNRWSKPLVLAPLLLALRSVQAGHWVSAVVGISLGISLGLLPQSRRWASRLAPWPRWIIPLGLFVTATLLVFISSLRIYSLTGAEYPNASDDGLAYYGEAVAFAQDPRLFFTSELNDRVFFTGYYPLMGLWFRLVGGPHIPSWLLWHGLAGGLLAVSVYWIGRTLTGQVGFGVVAGIMAVADHVMLHLMSTMNQETFFFPCVYLALLLWSKAGIDRPQTQTRAGLLAGLILGASVVFRTTSVILPFAWYFLLLWERPRPSVRLAKRQVWLMLVGVFIPVALLIIRHRIAWGTWTLAGAHGEYKIIEWNYALSLHGVHLQNVGLIAWLRMLAAEPRLIWEHVIPSWGKQALELWTHRGFGQMDLVQGLNAPGPYQAALTSVLTVSALIGALVAIRRRTRLDLVLLSLPVCFTSFVLLFYVLNSRYRAPFIPALYLFSCLGFSLAVAQARSRVAAVASVPASEAIPHVPAQPAASG